MSRVRRSKCQHVAVDLAPLLLAPITERHLSLCAMRLPAPLQKPIVSVARTETPLTDSTLLGPHPHQYAHPFPRGTTLHSSCQG
jgi:hypothetical protein